MYAIANFLITCRAASSSSSLSAPRLRRHLLLVIVPIVVLSMATDFANGMGCASSKDQASSSPSSPARHSNASAGAVAGGGAGMSINDQTPSSSPARHSNAGAGGSRRPIAVSNLPDVQQTDNVWPICLKHCGKYNGNPTMCDSTQNIILMERKQCRCKMLLNDRCQ